MDMLGLEGELILWIILDLLSHLDIEFRIDHRLLMADLDRNRIRLGGVENVKMVQSFDRGEA